MKTKMWKSKNEKWKWLNTARVTRRLTLRKIFDSHKKLKSTENRRIEIKQYKQILSNKAK